MWDKKFEELLRRYSPFLDPDEPLAKDTNLRDAGLDSLGTVELLASLENMYDIRFIDDSLTLDTFSTPEVLWETMSNISAAAGAAG